MEDYPTLESNESLVIQPDTETTEYVERAKPAAYPENRAVRLVLDRTISWKE